jgi:dTDP-4-dehydrorhamnose 3,5-epimerase
MRREWSELRDVSLSAREVHRDERGSFSKVFDAGAGAGITATQVCVSSNHLPGTLRGLHVQLAPHLETKRLWCTAGEVWDVLVDLRPGEPTHGDWVGVHLEAARPAMLTIPPGVAHGFLTLTHDASLVYLIEGEYAPESARTLRWDDPTVGVEWPAEVTVISAQDRAGQPWPVS